MTPISPFRPRRWKGKVISNKSKVNIVNLDYKKRPIAAAADNLEVRNIKSISLEINKNVKISLLHDKERTLIKKIKNEQSRKKH